ncbi:hypothetical protein ACJJIF_12150 [Microbulbifer sp. SSSA002]|uniref:hypothetical protein n=2 Tax=unclassified Microbulbifer TaxID=2619833 RepID=UPI00403901CF
MVGESAVFFPRKYWAAPSQTMAGKVLVVGPERASHNQASQARPTPSGLGWTAYALLRLPLLAALSANMESPTIVNNLDGYLQCLRRLSNNACDFWANSYVHDGNLEKGLISHLNGQDVSIGKSYRTNYEGISAELSKHVFQKVTCVSEDQKNLIEWDITEYIEMACREVDEEANPIYKEQSMIFQAKSEFHGEYIYLVVPASNQAIVVGFATRA